MSSRATPPRAARDGRRLDPAELETREWLASLDEVLERAGPARARRVLEDLQLHAQRRGVPLPITSQTPYVNTIRPSEEPPYPGDQELERRIKSLVRWNAMAMVVRANRESEGIGGHISTYASAATLYEVGFHHVWRGREHACGGDHVYFQGHASPGVYARAFLEGRLSEGDLERFRRELDPRGGLPSYPHPRAMPAFWEFPTVSMGLGPLMAVYRARMMRYLEHRDLVEPTDARVWCFIGDGECDEPESLAGLSLAAREGLDNLVFVVSCNLQRLDGPVRGNGKIVQELEAVFRGVGWNVIKVLFGAEWDPFLAADHDGRLTRRLGEALDGDWLKYRVEGGAYAREHFWGVDPRLAERVTRLSDAELWRMSLGGHDPAKVWASYAAALASKGSPTVILAKTVKGYGLGEAGEGRNVTHQQKKLNEAELLQFRDRFDVPVPDAEIGAAPFYRPEPGSPELEYLLDRRRELGGFVPARRARVTVPAGGSEEPDSAPGDDREGERRAAADARSDFDDKAIDEALAEFRAGTGERGATTTMAMVRVLSRLLKVEGLGPRLVPIVPDEARTFGMESLFRQYGIYSSVGQLYEPVDRANLLYYREARDGQILEEGITEAGSLASFIAAGTAHTMHGVDTIPVFFFYSMFGFQRVGDLVWAAADSMTRGFLVGGTAGRTTLPGEGLQHQDGQSPLLALPVPGLRAYDPAYAYELATIVADGLRRMRTDDEDALVYVTVGNESYPQPAMPDGPGQPETVEQGILRGLYRVADAAGEPPPVRLLGSGAILREVLAARELLRERFDVDADAWSATSWGELLRDAQACERHNRLHPTAEPRRPWLERCFADAAPDTVFVAASDWVQALPGALARWLPGRLLVLGTDGFGRSDSRERLRDRFEVDRRHVAAAALAGLARAGAIPAETVRDALAELEIDPERLDPANPRIATPRYGDDR